MNNKGQGLIEALIALGAAVVIISAITIAVVTAVHNSDFAKYQNLATGFAQQGIETVAQQSQLDWNHTATYGGTLPFCLAQGATTLPPSSSTSCKDINAGSMFIREVDFTKIPPQLSCTNLSSPCCSSSLQPGIGAPDFCTNNPSLCSSQVTVTVKWTDGKCSSASDFCHSVKLDSCIQDIYRIQ
jgi:type II secretory pathway pseudopilin PulG